MGGSPAPARHRGNPWSRSHVPTPCGRLPPAGVLAEQLVNPPFDDCAALALALLDAALRFLEHPAELAEPPVPPAQPNPLRSRDPEMVTVVNWVMFRW